MSDVGRTEIAKASEAKFRDGETSCALPKGSRMSPDSVFDGTTLRLGYIETDVLGKKNTPEQQKQKADELARTLNSLGGDTKILGHEISGEDILALPKKVEEILSVKNGKIAGLLINVLGNDQNPQESALATVALLDYITAHHTEPTEKLLKDAVAQGEAVFKASGDEKPFPDRGLAIAVIKRNGEMGIAASRNAAVVLEKSNGRAFDKAFRLYDETWVSDDGYLYQVIKGKDKLQPKDGVVLCAEDAVEKIRSHKPIGEVVTDLVAESTFEHRPHGAAGVEFSIGSLNKPGAPLPEIRGGNGEDTGESDHVPAHVGALDEPADDTLRKLADGVDSAGADKTAMTPELIVTEPRPASASETYGTTTTPEIIITEPTETVLATIASEPEVAVTTATASGDRMPQSDASSAEARAQAHEFPYYRDTGEKVSIEQFEKTHPEYVTAAQELVTIAKGIIVKNDGESDVQYNQRIMDAVVDRLKYPGDYETKDDALYTAVSTHPRVLERADLSLIGVEVQQAHYTKGVQKMLREAEQNRLQEVARRKVRTIVRRGGEPAHVMGEYDPFFDEAGKAKETPKKDLYAFGLIADQLLDISDTTLQVTPGQTKTYRELMRDLENILNKTREDPNAPDPEKDAAARRLVSIRSQFYSYAIEAMRTIDQSQYINPDATTHSSKDTIISHMHRTLRVARTKSVEQLINEYKGVSTGLSERNKAEMTRLLGKQPQLKMEYALKGGELMQRRISYESEAQAFSSTVRYKEFVEAPQSTQSEPVSRQPIVEPRPPVRVPSVPPSDQEGPPEPPPGPVASEPARTAPPEVVPAPVDDHESSTEVISSEGEGRLEPIRPAPRQQQPPQQQAASQPEPLKTSANLGAAVDPERRVQNVFQLTEHSMSHDLAQMPRPAYTRAPLFGNALWVLRHPIKLGWQNGLARTVFEQQHLRFVSDAVDIVKRGTADGTVPVEVTPELLERALQEGRNMRNNQSWWRRAVWRASDYVKGFTGISQTSEQILARRWFEQQVINPRDQWPQELQQVDQRTLVEQTKLGDRFARNNLNTLIRSNRAVLREGETRHELPQEQQAAVSQRIKGFIEQYANGQFDERGLVRTVNQYLLGDFRGSLPPDLQREFNASEVATNILTIAHEVTGRNEQGQVVDANRWNRYQTEHNEQGQTAWEAFNINVLFGRGEWGGVGGRREMGALTERLARRMANREALRGTGALTGAVAFAQDAVTYGGAWLGGWAYAGAIGGTSTLARTAGGAFGVGVVSYVKEAGIDLSRFGMRGLKGRYQKEIEQLSRERARGRVTPQDARIRLGIEGAGALVNMRSVEDYAQELTPLLTSEVEQLPAGQAQQLLTSLAGLDARLRLTDLSSTRELNYKVQNYIQYVQGQENQQHQHLKGLLENGLAKLALYCDANPQFLNGASEFMTGTRFAYRTQQQQLGLFERYSALAEAQLRVGTRDQQVRQWLIRELQLSQADADSMMQTLFGNVNQNVAEDQSIQGKERIMDRLRFRRGVAIAARTMVTAGIAPIAYGVPLTEAGDFAHDVLSTGGDFTKYFRDWGQIANGNVPVETIDGHPFVNVTPFQEAILKTEHHLYPQTGNPVATQIDNATVNLPPGVKYDAVHDALVDVKNARLVDMTEYRLESNAQTGMLDVYATRDLNGDGRIDVVDNQIANGLFNQRMADAEINLSRVQGPDRVTSREIEILRSSGTHPDTIVGYKTNIPDGTEWKRDFATGKWDLVAKPQNGQWPDVVVIDDAEFDTTGKLIGFGSKHSAIDISHIQEGGGVIVKKGPEAVAEWDKLATHIDRTDYYAYNTPFSEKNELQEYTYKHGDVVTLDMSTMKEGWQHGVKPESINVQDAIRNHEAGFAIRLPGFQDKVVWIPEDVDGKADGQLHLDPNSNAPVPGTSLTVGQITRMLIDEERLKKLPDGNIATEFFNRQDVFKIGANGEYGLIQAGRLIDQDGQNVFQSFAAIRGNGPASITTETPGNFLSTIKLTDVLKTKIEERTPTYSFTATEPPLHGIDFPLIPIPGRVNIEKSTLSRRESPPFEPTPYEGGYSSESENERKETLDAQKAVETLMQESPHLTSSEKENSITKAKEFINRSESQQIGPMNAANNFKQMWEFVTSHPDFDELIKDNGSVTVSTTGVLMPIIASLASDPAEQNELLQVIGKFVQSKTINLADPDVELRIKVLIQAYRASKSIISPI